MNNIQNQKAYLLLEDGSFYEGQAGGMIGTTTGELCFNTGMTGYQEVFTDPSYFGQLLIATNAHIGNYGVKSTDTESETIQISGLICKNFTPSYSRELADNDIQQYFKDNKKVVIHGIDTRAIVRLIRTKGAMNGIISSEISDKEELQKILSKVPSMDGLELASKVSTPTVYDLGEPDAKHKVAVLDFGTKKNILRCLIKRGCKLRVFPAKTSFEEIAAWQPDGYFLSNGPGDPAPMGYAVSTVKQILEKDKPIFGICLGHQLLALANDIPTYKMHHGHRGINHPVKNLVTGLCEITSQNHGFGVDPEVIKANADKVEVTHMNLNDDTVEGIKVIGKRAFSVQYHPEAAPGPHDSRYLFDQFVSMLSTVQTTKSIV